MNDSTLHFLVLPGGYLVLLRAEVDDLAALGVAYPGASYQAGPLDMQQALELMARQFGADPARWPLRPEAVQRLVAEGHEALLALADSAPRRFVHAEPAGCRSALASAFGLVGLGALVLALVDPDGSIPPAMVWVGAVWFAVSALIALYRRRDLIDGPRQTVTRQTELAGLPILRRRWEVDPGSTVLFRHERRLVGMEPSVPSEFAVVTLVTGRGTLDFVNRLIDGSPDGRDRDWAESLGLALEVAKALGIPVRWAGPGSSAPGRASWLFPLLGDE